MSNNLLPQLLILYYYLQGRVDQRLSDSYLDMKYLVHKYRSLGICRRLGDFEKEIQLANTYIHETPFCPIFLGSVFNSNIVIWFLDQIFLQSDFIVHPRLDLVILDLVKSSI